MNNIVVNDGKGVNFELNLYNNTASVIQSPYAKDSILIQRYINFQNRLFTITTIKMKSFYRNKNIKSISFSNDSELLTIEEEAFEFSSLESIQIPSSVISIGKSAFCGCSNLIFVNIPHDSKMSVVSEDLFSSTSIKSFDLPPNIVRIEKNAFSSRSFEILNIPNDSKLVYIGEHAFEGSNIKSLFIPPLVQKLEEEWCFGTNELTKIYISPKNQFFSLIDEKIVVSKSNNNVPNYDTLCFAVRNIESIIIPSFIKTIQSFSFSYCKNLQTVIFANNSELQSIKKGAFMFTSITSIELPKKVSLIESYAFEDCFHLKKFEFPKNKKIKTIGESLLRASPIKKISIPSSVTEINYRAFSDCHNLEIVEFQPGSKLKMMQNYVFYYNKKLETITLPETLKEVGSCIFCGCSKLKNVNFSTKSPLKHISSLMFFSTGLESAIIPANAKIIYNESFAECDFLKSVEFLADSISIGYLVFDNASSLLIVSLPNAKKIEISDDSFSNISEEFILFTLPCVKIKIS